MMMFWRSCGFFWPDKDEEELEDSESLPSDPSLPTVPAEPRPDLLEPDSPEPAELRVPDPKPEPKPAEPPALLPPRLEPAPPLAELGTAFTTIAGWIVRFSLSLMVGFFTSHVVGPESG